MHAGIQSLGTPHPPDRGMVRVTRPDDPVTVGLTRLGQGSGDHESSEKSDLNALEAFMKKHAKHVSLQDMSAFTGYLIQSACDT